MSVGSKVTLGLPVPSVKSATLSGRDVGTVGDHAVNSTRSPPASRMTEAPLRKMPTSRVGKGVNFRAALIRDHRRDRIEVLVEDIMGDPDRFLCGGQVTSASTTL